MERDAERNTGDVAHVGPVEHLSNGGRAQGVRLRYGDDVRGIIAPIAPRGKIFSWGLRRGFRKFCGLNFVASFFENFVDAIPKILWIGFWDASSRGCRCIPPPTCRHLCALHLHVGAHVCPTYMCVPMRTPPTCAHTTPPTPNLITLFKLSTIAIFSPHACTDREKIWIGVITHSKKFGSVCYSARKILLGTLQHSKKFGSV